MAPPTRRAVPRKRPAARPVPQARAGLEMTSVAENVEEGGAGQQREELLATFEAALREQPGMDEKSLEIMLQQFRETIDSAPLDPSLTVPDRNMWLETIDALVRSQSITEADRSELIREFDEAMAPLQDQDVLVALEFAQRIQRDGREKALEWFNAQREQQEQAAGQQTPAREGPSQFRQSITKSRSRRLRGPPGV
ncbi:hypothetical protein [Luteimonas aquatica]|uniref:hypothetical protein n=1 Tax=Luteimonas aquatica TaxID=450364 RepID=UPI001F590C8C|nr:hypothetical protein [Luteimonas aquatica]